MTVDRERLLQLIHGHLEQTLSEAEQRELEAVLDQDESARRELVLASTVNQELYSLHESVPQEAPSPAPATRRLNRRIGRQGTQSQWGLAFAAAAIFIALILLFVSSPSESPKAPYPVAEGKLRRDAERRLAELEERRIRLEQAKTTEKNVETPEKRKVELSNLEDEKRKIEEELKAAIAEARRREQNAPAPAPAPAPTPAPAPATPSTVVKESPTKVMPVARIERVEGEGWILRKEGKTPAREGMDVQSGDGLETGAGRLALRFPDRTLLDLRSETAVVELSDDGASSKRLMVVRGAVHADVSKQPAGRPMMLRTPHAEATVLGTSLRLLVEPGEKGASRLEVQEGKVRFSRLMERKESVEVVTGHYAVAASGTALSSRPLPPERIGTPASPVLVSLTLINAETGRPILQFSPLEDGRTITLSELPTRNLNVLATTSPPTVGCVVFSWDGTAMPESNRPYLMAGNDAGGKPKAWTPAVGDHVLTATPYTGPANLVRREGTGTAGAGLTLRLRVR
jgi:ferric-dicitrate binding protein FerR (iron transport regulator)